jgi:histidinol phosphatase-like enzyme
MIYFVDIDETICFNKIEIPMDYSKAQPNYKVISKINKLYNEGHRIVYWTARGTTTGKDWLAITTAQLDSWGVKRHEIRMGKPFYDVIIDDKSINPRDLEQE